MNNANKCPQCKQFIIGTYCYTCKKDINEMKISTDSMPDFIKNFFDKEKELK